jgi:hypothetical protein
MKQILITIVLGLLTVMPALAQETVDKEMRQLMDVVASLRQSDQQQKKAKWNEALATLSKDKKWTIMDEITSHAEECRLTDKSVTWFSLNRILTRSLGLETNKARGEFNNGEDKNYNYSLIERSVKAGKTVSYQLKSREGRQVFVVMPYDAATAKLAVEVQRGGKSLAKGVLKDGNIQVVVPESKGVKASDVLTLQIKNTGSQNTAMVILNHNTRKK